MCVCVSHPNEHPNELTHTHIYIYIYICVCCSEIYQILSYFAIIYQIFAIIYQIFAIIYQIFCYLYTKYTKYVCCSEIYQILSYFAQSAWATEYTEMSDFPSVCPGHDAKQSDGEASVMQELWRMRSTHSLSLLPGPLWLGVK